MPDCCVFIVIFVVRIIHQYDELLILDDDDFDIKPYYPNNLVKTNFKNTFVRFDCVLYRFYG